MDSRGLLHAEFLEDGLPRLALGGKALVFPGRLGYKLKMLLPVVNRGRSALDQWMDALPFPRQHIPPSVVGWVIFKSKKIQKRVMLGWIPTKIYTAVKPLICHQELELLHSATLRN